RPAKFRTQSPDESVELAFPEGAGWVNEPLGILANENSIEPPTRMFKGNGRDVDYSVMVVPLDPKRWYLGLEWDAREALRGATRFASEEQLGPLEQVTCNGYPATQQVISGRQNRPFVFRVVAVNDTAYVMFVSGHRISENDSRVQKFFDSFRHAEVPPPP